MRYPLHLSFKIAAIASQIYATDADGNSIFYVKQKLFKLKENIEVFTDSSKQTKLYTIKADRVIDISPTFSLYDESGNVLGSVKRFGRASIWKASYEIKMGQDSSLTVTEANPWAKVMDTVLREIPILSLFSGYFFHPRYHIKDASSQTIAELEKQPAFFEGKYTLSSDTVDGKDDNTKKLFAALMMVVVLRERLRG